MRYSNSYLLNHDIDWFCRVGCFYIHVASAGGTIPRHINDVEYLRNVQHRIELLPDIFSNEDIVYNEQTIRNVLGREVETGKNYADARTHYIKSFTAMARKGFVSFDRTNILDPDDNRYHVVCYPKFYHVTDDGNKDIMIYNDIIDGWGEIIPVEFYLDDKLKWRIR